MNSDIPKDRYNLVYVSLIVIGTGIALPINIFMTSHSYFVNYKLKTNDSSTDIYREYYLSYVGVAAGAPNVMFQTFNIINYLSHARTDGSLRTQMGFGILTEIIFFVVTIILAMVDTSSWTVAFFYVTIVSIIGTSIGAGVFANSALSTAANLPRNYVSVPVTGIGLTYVIVALNAIISVAISSDPKITAVFYFSAALVLLVSIYLAFIYLESTEFFKYHNQLRTGKEVETELLSKAPIEPLKRFKRVMAICWQFYLTIFLQFFVTSSLFPAVTANIKPLSNMLPAMYFTPVVCFLNYAVFLFAGTTLPSMVQCRPSLRTFWIMTALRFLFIPFFLLSNFNTEYRTWKVVFENDYVLLLAISLLGFMSGYFASLSFVGVAQRVPPEEAKVATMIMSLCIASSMFVGANFSFLLTTVVTI